MLVKQRYWRGASAGESDGIADAVAITLRVKHRGYDDNVVTAAPDSDLVIYRGWVDIDINSILYTTEVDGERTVRKSKYANYQSAPFRDMVSRYPDYLYCNIL